MPKYDLMLTYMFEFPLTENYSTLYCLKVSWVAGRSMFIVDGNLKVTPGPESSN